MVGPDKRTVESDGRTPESAPRTLAGDHADRPLVPPFKEVVTAALLVIGGKILSGPIDSDPRALAILHEWMKTTGPEMNEAPPAA